MGIGMALLGVWLILHGLMTLMDLSFQNSEMVMALIAVIAGILILIRK